jgi:tetrahydromethanopterin S-methyltransferase subunit C
MENRSNTAPVLIFLAIGLALAVALVRPGARLSSRFLWASLASGFLAFLCLNAGMSCLDSADPASIGCRKADQRFLEFAFIATAVGFVVLLLAAVVATLFSWREERVRRDSSWRRSLLIGRARRCD